MKNEIFQYVEDKKEELYELNNYLYNNPEIGFQEYKACESLISFLGKYNFKITKKAGGLDTAFIAEACPTGTSYPRIDILAEYDALELGESIGGKHVATHACGHNIIAAAAAGAGISMLAVMKKHNIEGTLRIVGTPAEEGGGGKIIMQRYGVFEGSDAQILLHPTTGTTKIAGRCKSNLTMKVKYKGVSAHAGSHREKGINAQDAANICYLSIGCLRYQLPNDVQVFPLFANIGSAKNIIPDAAEMSIAIRCFSAKTLDDVIPKVKNCIHAGALATGCEVEVTESEKYLGRVRNYTFERILRKNAELLNEPIMEGLVDDNGGEDFGNLTRCVPGIMIYPTLLPGRKISGHTTEFLDLCNTDKAREVVLFGSRIMAYSVLDLFSDHSLIEEAKEELKNIREE